MTFSHVTSAGRRRPRVAAIALGSMLVAAGMIGCKSTPGGQGSRSPASRCDEEAPATLRVSNSSGRVLDVYVARDNAPPQLLTQVSPGTSSSPVPGPADLGVRYNVINPSAGQRLASVTWIRRMAREVSSGVIVELICSAPGAP